MISTPNKEEKKPEQKIRTQEISSDESVNEPQSVKVSFMDEETVTKFAGEQTKKSTDNGFSIDENSSTEDVNKHISDYEDGKSAKLEYKDFLKFAEFIINLIDIGFSTALNWFARDTAVTAYTLPSPNKKILIEQLALILSKYQTKFKVEFLFLISLVVMYSAPAMAAYQMRKDKLNTRKQPEKTPDQPYYKHDSSKTELEKTIVTEKIVDEPKKTPFKRKQGPPKRHAGAINV